MAVMCKGEKMNKKRIYITGPMGSDRLELGESIAKEKGYQLIDLDKEIEIEDGRTIKRISMMMGEHAYHDKEYHKLKELEDREEVVVVCGDGVLFDNMCESILEKGEVLIADWEKPIETLWEGAVKDINLPYAFIDALRYDERTLEEGESLNKSRARAFKKFEEIFEERKKYFLKYIK